MAQDYSQDNTIGVAMNSGFFDEKAELIDLLDRSRELADKLCMYVQGQPFERTLRGTIGALQRSTPTVEQV